MRRLFLEADDLGRWYRDFGVHETWQDLGLGLLVTLAENEGYHCDSLSLKEVHSWAEWRMIAKNYDLLCMNLRSWRFHTSVEAARVAKAANSAIKIWVGGIHCTVALPEVEAVPHFDHIVQGNGEEAFLDLLSGQKMPRVIRGELRRFKNLDDLPFIRRDLLPDSPTISWPLEGPNGWATGHCATIITGRACPYQCSFCASELDHFGPPRRRSVDNVIDELNMIDKQWGPIGSVVFHDSLFFQNPAWLEEFIRKYPGWPFWAAARADHISKWPSLFEATALLANWRAISVGFESGSDNVLQVLNKQCTAEQNRQAIEIINQLQERVGNLTIYANFMLGIPGETKEDALATVKMAKSIVGAIPGVVFYNPYPGTVLGETVRAQGLALDDRYSAFYTDAPKIAGMDYDFYTVLKKEIGI